jgi:hypothetical protein
LCGAEDAEENAIAIGWHDVSAGLRIDKEHHLVVGFWDTEEHRLIVEKAQNNCPFTKEGEDPYRVNLGKRHERLDRG